MALTQTLVQMRTNVRQLTDTAGVSAVARHSDANVNDYINRGLAALYRILTQALPDQRYLATNTITTQAALATYTLPSDFDHLISVDLLANGMKSWLVSYKMHERPALTNPAMTVTGIPFAYRLRGGNVELLPSPTGVYAVNLWYVPSVSTLTTDGQPFDTISRLDDYVIWYAARNITARDKAWELNDRLTTWLTDLRSDIEVIARTRDKNAPSRIVDESHANRFGRHARGRRYT